MRRSSRAAKAKHFIEVEEAAEQENEEEVSERDESDDHDSDEIYNSGDEWQPEIKSRRKGKRGREEVQESESESDEEEDGDKAVDEEEEDELVVKTRKDTSIPTAKKSKKSSSNGKNTQTHATRMMPHSRNSTKNVVTDEDILAAQAAIEQDEEEERQEQEASAKEAAEMWKQVRKKKQDKIASNQAKEVAAKASAARAAVENSSNSNASTSLHSWLGLPEPVWPTTCADAMINDRDSLFVGFVYALSTPSQSVISQLLSHLGKTVHPKAIPTNRLPPAMQHLATNRRGATHDMHAWRCLALKRGRTGLNGPEDFGLEEGMEDDGERYGANQISKIIKQLGATDVLVVVSRWYGGTMLGPIRFQHIENCARAALSQYMIHEAIIPLKEQLCGLDDQLSDLRSQLGTSSTSTFVKPQYDDLDFEKVERLIGARKKAIEMMQKRLTSIAPSQSQPFVEKESTQVELQEDILNSLSRRQEVPTEVEVKVKVVDNDDGQEAEDLTGWDALE